MSLISTTHFNWLPQQSIYNQMQLQRIKRNIANQDLADYSAAVTGSFNNAMANQYSGIANLAAQAAAKRLGITLPSQADTGTTSKSNAPSTPAPSPVDHVAAMNDYLKSLNQMLNGTASVASQARSAITSAGNAQAAIANMLDGAHIGGTSSATVSQIINGTAGLANSASSKMSADGNMFSTIDRIINSAVAPMSVNVTA